MNEKEVLKETHRSAKPVSGEKPKKRYYKPKKKKVEEKHDVFVENSEKPYVKISITDAIKLTKYVGEYCLPDNRACLSFEKKPKWLHRKFMSLLLGVTWKDKK